MLTKTTKQDHQRQEHISTNEAILYWFTIIS